MTPIIEELRDALPPVFAGTAIARLTGDAIVWATIQNKRTLKQIPETCFAYSGRRVLVRRDLFLAWWAGTLSETRTAPSFGAMALTVDDAPAPKRRGRPPKVVATAPEAA